MTTIKPITTKKELEIFWKLRNFLRIHSFARPAMESKKRCRDYQDVQDDQDAQEGEQPPAKTQCVPPIVNHNHDAPFQNQVKLSQCIRMLRWMMAAMGLNTLFEQNNNNGYLH
jgi:hypothetical protein